MSSATRPPAPALRDELAEALETLRQGAAGDVPGMSYSEALGRAARKLHDRTKPYRIRPTPRA